MKDHIFQQYFKFGQNTQKTLSCKKFERVKMNLDIDNFMLLQLNIQRPLHTV